MEPMQLLLQLVAGLVGGNAAGAGLKNISMGTALNSIIGLIGGFGGAQILALLGLGGAAAGGGAGLDTAALIQSIVGGGAGGGILVAIVGAIKKTLAR